MNLGQAVLTMAFPLLATLGAGSDTKPFEPQEAVVLNTPDEASVPGPLECRERIDGEQTLAAFQNLIRASISQSQRAAQLRQVYPEGTSFQLWELPACQLLLQRRITDEQYLDFMDKTVPLLVPATSLPTNPALLEPKEGATFDFYPRRTVVSWDSVPTAAKYVLEVQVMMVRMGRRADGSLFPEFEYWAPHNEGLHHANVAGTSAIFYFIGAQRGRVRVRAVATNGDASAPSRWRNFRYKK